MVIPRIGGDKLMNFDAVSKLPGQGAAWLSSDWDALALNRAVLPLAA